MMLISLKLVSDAAAMACPLLRLSSRALGPGLESFQGIVQLQKDFPLHRGADWLRKRQTAA